MVHEGGYGTLEELLEVITWAQLGIHDKPVRSHCISFLLMKKIIYILIKFFFFFFLEKVGLLNVDGFYNSLLSFIDKAVEEGFICPKARHIIVSAPSIKELVKKMEVT